MQRVIIATTTFYKSTDELRFKLACELITKAVAVKYPIIIVDGSPDSSVRKEFNKRGALVFPQIAQGMAGSRRELFDCVRVVYCKNFYRGKVDFVIIGRIEKSMKSHPEFQVKSETLANTVYRNFFSVPNAAPMVGPVAFSSSVILYFSTCNRTKYGLRTGYIQHIAPLEATAHEHKVVCIPVDFMYPKEQKEEEEKDISVVAKRLQQAQELIEAYLTIRYLRPGLIQS